MSDTSSESPRLTPMMAQFMKIKAANPDCLLFYRMGDFYELFFDDAEIASKILGIMLTKRGKHLGEDIPMCGVPVERADDYLQRLIASGQRVAVCEQLEDPAEAKKRGAKSVVKRDVVRLVTAGTLVEEALLSPGQANWLVAFSVANSRGGQNQSGTPLVEKTIIGCAAADISTGEFILCEGTIATLPSILARLEPQEILLPEPLRDLPLLASLWRESKTAIVRLPAEGRGAGQSEKRLADYFGLSDTAGLGAFTPTQMSAGAALVAYLDRTQKGARVPLLYPKSEAAGGVMEIDAATRANLEITRRLSGEKQGSLLSEIDRTVTAAGARLLMARLSAPVLDIALLNQRFDSIAFFSQETSLCLNLRKALKSVPDASRALTRLSMQRGSPRDLGALQQVLEIGEALKAALHNHTLPAELAALMPALAPEAGNYTESWHQRLAQALTDELPAKASDGGFIRAGFDPSLDDLRLFAQDSRKVIAAMQEKYAEAADYRSLRIKHNNFLGYYLEVPQNIGEKLLQPPHNALFIHRQTMAGAMRFSTTELAEADSKIATAADKAYALERAHFAKLTEEALMRAGSIRVLCDALAVFDVSASLAMRAGEDRWTRPLLTEGHEFEVEAGQHPVVASSLKAQGVSFIANSCALGPKEADQFGQILLVTGPNMAGKSTYLRQNALLAILAQMGSFVPAKRFTLGLVDRLFSRVGAADDLARGRSTFMVEMVETAAILNQATAKSLVILDEIGRGTATYDGLSIALASVEQLHNENRCRALFATHFHELTRLTQRLTRLRPITMRVTEWQGEVVLLHEVIEGAADRSYGIEVAKRAGLPKKVIARAKAVLADLEKAERDRSTGKSLDELPLFALMSESAPQSAPLEAPQEDPLRMAFEALNPDDFTPRAALEELYRLKALSNAFE